MKSALPIADAAVRIRLTSVNVIRGRRHQLHEHVIEAFGI